MLLFQEFLTGKNVLNIESRHSYLQQGISFNFECEAYFTEVTKYIESIELILNAFIHSLNFFKYH